MLDLFPLCCGQIEPGPQVTWGLVHGRGRRCLTQLTEASSLLHAPLYAPTLGFCSSNSRLLAILLGILTAGRFTWYFLKKAARSAGQNTSHLFLSSYFTVFFCCFVSDWRSPRACLLSASHSSPGFCWLLLRTRGG